MRRAALVLLVLTLVMPLHAVEPVTRWTAATPDELVALSLRAAERDGQDALARLLMIYTLHDEASFGKARSALERIARGKSRVAADAGWLSRVLASEEAGTWRGVAKLRYDGDAPEGLVRTFAILGPFEDTGGGLARREGPEAPGHRWAGADYSWGVYAVHTRRSLVDSVTARGLPLDLYVHPRSESCTYLGSAVTVPSARPLIVRIAASGSFRLSWDRTDVASSEEVHASALVDRAAVRIDATAGQHLLIAKVCSGARPDSGRVRVRLTDERGRALPLATSSVPAELDRPAASKAAFAAVPTSLEQAIAGAPGTELVAAVVRTLAGADDLRANKAPGLLDRVVGEADADRLALAGFLSGFAANKSGWLGRALERAQRDGDTATASFAQRALVAARLDARLVDLAQATVERRPLATSRDVHARWLRALALARLGGTGLRYRALGELRTLVREHGARTPVAVWQTLAELGDVTPAAEHLGAWQRWADLAPERRGPGWVAAHRMLGPEALEAAASSALLQQTDARQVGAIAQQLLDAGRYRAAREAYVLATLVAPNRQAGFEGLTRVDTLLARRGGGDARMLAPLERALQLEPSDARLAAELAFRRGESESGPQAGADAAYLVKPSVFLARAKHKPAPKDGVFDRQLHWRRVVRLHDDKRVSQLMHYAREIIVEPRTENERYENLPGGYDSELLIARVHKKDGAVVAPEEQDAAGPMVRWPKLERGDVVEIAVRNWTPGPVGRRGDPPFYFSDYAGSTDTHPVLYNEVVLDAPLSSPFAYDIVGGKPDERKEETRGRRRITRLVWHAPPTIPDEPLSPHPSELLPVVVGSVYPSWESFLAWYRGAVEGFTTPDEQVKRIAQELTAGKASREAKIEALFNFVADQIRYVNFVSGEWWLPNRPQQLLARRQGDCDDKAMLLISLLEAVGIQATEVLVQTRMTRQRAAMRSASVAIPMFDHGIIYLPGHNGAPGRYLDATSPQSRMGAPPAMDAGALALHVDGQARIIETPMASADMHGADVSWSLTLHPDGAADLQGSERHVGDAAFRLRNHLAEEDARAQWVEQHLLAGWFDSLSMEPKVTFDGALEGGAARVAYRARSGSVARKEGDELVVTLAPPMPITAQLAPLTARTLPVELPPHIAPQHRRMRIDIVAPAGYRIAALPPDADADGGPFGKAGVRFASSGNRVTIERTIAFEQPFIPVADYPRWRRWLQNIDRLLQHGVRLVRVG